MTYEEYKAVGQVTDMKTYKGSPKEIAELLAFKKNLKQPSAEELELQKKKSPEPPGFREG